MKSVNSDFIKTNCTYKNRFLCSNNCMTFCRPHCRAGLYPLPWCSISFGVRALPSFLHPSVWAQIHETTWPVTRLALWITKGTLPALHVKIAVIAMQSAIPWLSQPEDSTSSRAATSQTSSRRSWWGRSHLGSPHRSLSPPLPPWTLQHQLVGKKVISVHFPIVMSTLVLHS